MAASNNGTVSLTSPSLTSTVPGTTSLLPSTASAVTSDAATSITSVASSIPPSATLPDTTSSAVVLTSVVTESPTTAGATPTVITLFTTSTEPQTAITPTAIGATGTQTGSSGATTSTGAALSASNDGTSGSGLGSSGTIAVAVVVPIVAVVLLVLAGIWFWRKRKQRKEAEELRRKEMEEYGYNPNNDPTLPGVIAGGSAMGDEASTMKDSAGYRGWGTTTTAQRKPSTTMGSQPGVARSDSGGNGGYAAGQPSPSAGTANNSADGRSGDPLVSPIQDENPGALGAAPVAGANRANNGINRGPSNASSAYSGNNRSDVSSEGPLPMGSPPYHDNYMYAEGDPNTIGTAYGGGYDSQPVIRDVSARRNTRIESPSVVPHQGTPGIAQNF